MNELLPIAASFACALCGARAASIWLEILPEGPAIRRESFTGLLIAPLARETAVRLRAALDLGEGAVFDLDPEYVPCHCPACEASYCGDHWDRQDVFDDDLPEWHDSIRGRCPNGHERMLED